MNILHFYSPGFQRFLLRERYRFWPGSGRKESILSVFRAPYAAKCLATHFSRCGENAVWVRKGLWLARRSRVAQEASQAQSRRTATVGREMAGLRPGLLPWG